MSLRLLNIYLSSESEEENLIDPQNANTDVIVVLNNKKKYIASFFSYDNIFELSNQHNKDQCYLSGDYFWDKNLVLVKSINRSLIITVVNDLLKEGDFIDVFRQLTK